MKYKCNEKKVNCLCYSLWAKKYQATLEDTGPPLKDSPTLKFRKKTQPPENIPLQNILNVNFLKSLIEAADWLKLFLQQFHNLILQWLSLSYRNILVMRMYVQISYLIHNIIR